MAAANPRADAAEVQDLYERIACLEEDYRFWYEGYERKRYGVQLAYSLDKALVDKLKWLKKQGTPSAYDPEFDVADTDTKLSKLDPEIADICEELIKVYKKLQLA